MVARVERTPRQHVRVGLAVANPSEGVFEEGPDVSHQQFSRGGFFDGRLHDNDSGRRFVLSGPLHDPRGRMEAKFSLPDVRSTLGPFQRGIRLLTGTHHDRQVFGGGVPVQRPEVSHQIRARSGCMCLGARSVPKYVTTVNHTDSRGAILRTVKRLSRLTTNVR